MDEVPDEVIAEIDDGLTDGWAEGARLSWQHTSFGALEKID